MPLCGLGRRLLALALVGASCGGGGRAAEVGNTSAPLCIAPLCIPCAGAASGVGFGTPAAVAAPALLSGGPCEVPTGFWSPDSQRLLLCPSDSCLGGNRCIEGHSGPFCATCAAGRFRGWPWQPTGCERCGLLGRGLACLWLLAAASAAVALPHALAEWELRRAEAPRDPEAGELPTYGTKLRVLMLSAQVVSGWTACYYTKFPHLVRVTSEMELFHTLAQALAFASSPCSFFLQEVVPLACLGTALGELLLVVLLPAAFVLAVWLSSLYLRRKEQVSHLEICASTVLWALYLTYTVVTTRAGQHLPVRDITFECGGEPDLGCLLRQDYRLRLGTPEYLRISWVAFMALAAYAICVPVLCFHCALYAAVALSSDPTSVVHQHRHRATRPASGSGSTLSMEVSEIAMLSLEDQAWLVGRSWGSGDLLPKEEADALRLCATLYTHLRPEAWCFEAVNLLRQLLVTVGVLVLSHGAVAHIFASLLVMFAYMLLVIFVRPYAERPDNFAQIGCSVALALFFASHLAALPSSMRSLDATAAAAGGGVAAGESRHGLLSPGVERSACCAGLVLAVVGIPLIAVYTGSWQKREIKRRETIRRQTLAHRRRLEQSRAQTLNTVQHQQEEQQKLKGSSTLEATCMGAVTRGGPDRQKEEHILSRASTMVEAGEEAPGSLRLPAVCRERPLAAVNELALGGGRDMDGEASHAEARLRRVRGASAAPYLLGRPRLQPLQDTAADSAPTVLPVDGLEAAAAPVPRLALPPSLEQEGGPAGASSAAPGAEAIAGGSAAALRTPQERRLPPVEESQLPPAFIAAAVGRFGSSTSTGCSSGSLPLAPLVFRAGPPRASKHPPLPPPPPDGRRFTPLSFS